MKAIEAGQPTVIFEDPAAIQPSLRQRVLGTPQARLERMPRGGTAETGQINNLWRLLGISMSGIQAGEQRIPDLVWQRYNPYRRDSSLDVPERLVIDNLNPALTDTQISGVHPATSGIEELVFNYASAFDVPAASLSRLDIEPLVVARSAGTINLSQWTTAMRGSSQAMDRARGSEREKDFILAAHIKSREDSGGKINCIYVTDVDVLSDEMLQVRDSPIQRGVEYRYQNVAFVLNLVDSMTSRNVYIPIRDRRPKYVTLRVVENTIKEATEEVDEQLQAYEIEFEKPNSGCPRRNDSSGRRLETPGQPDDRKGPEERVDQQAGIGPEATGRWLNRSDRNRKRCNESPKRCKMNETRKFDRFDSVPS